MKKIFAAICFLSLVGFGARVYADDTPASIPPVVDEVPLATEETPAPQEEAPPVVSAPVPRESVIVRVGDQVLFSGEVDLPAAGTAMIFSKDGGAHPVNARSVFALISALDQTSDAFSISSIQYYSSFGALYLQCITPNGQGEFCDNWQYVVNGVTPASGMETRVLSGGETIGLYFGSPHRVMLSTTNTTTDTEVVATAEKYNYQDNSWSALSGVSVGVTLPNEADPYNPKVLAVKAVDVHGTASFTLTTPALYKVGIADDYYFPLYDLSISRPIVGGLATNTGPTANKETNTPVFSLDKALVYLQSMQKDDGSFGADMYTDWVAVAYGAHGADKEKLISYLSTKTNTSNSLTDIERRTMALLSLGEDPYVFAGVNYVEKILSSFDGTQFGDPELINDDIFALIPLTASGYSASDEIISKTLHFFFPSSKAVVHGRAVSISRQPLYRHLRHIKMSQV